MTITLHQGDLPENIDLGDVIAVDTEAMGLSNHRDRLCLVQLSSGDGTAHLVQLSADQYDGATNLKKILADSSREKLFHFARFDVAILKLYLGVECTPLYCTRTASKLARTFTDKHGLRDLCKELLEVDINKQAQSSDWGAETLTQDQLVYAANDVFHLHALKDKLEGMLEREGRRELAHRTMECIMPRALLDIAGWQDVDIFAH